MIPKGKSYYKRKVNSWRDPLPKPVDWSSAHCSHGDCRICRRDRYAAQRYATAKLEAATAPSMFWDSKLDRGQDRLGPSAPDFWLQSRVVVA